MNLLQHFERLGLQLIGLVSQKIIRSNEPTELPLQPKSKKKKKIKDFGCTPEEKKTAVMIRHEICPSSPRIVMILVLPFLWGKLSETGGKV